MRALFIFLDGVGIGADDPEQNPFLSARLPHLQRLLGRIPTQKHQRVDHSSDHGEATAIPLDANLDVDGLPQSGTGQIALLTGVNAAQEFGRHFGPWAPVALRPVLEARNVLKRVLERGDRVAFANAYPRGWASRRRRLAAVPLAAHAAGLLTRHAEALGAREAVASEIVNDGWIHHLGHHDLPPVTAFEAGQALAAISRTATLTLFAHYTTDLAGHRRSIVAAHTALERVDAFVGGLLHALDRETLLLVASDHGNVEELSQGHTRNPVLCILAGPDAVDRADGLKSILDLPTAILEWTRDG